MRQLYSAKEIAAMHLPGLPSSRDNVRARAEKEGWYSEERTGLGGTRRVYEIPARYRGRDGVQGDTQSRGQPRKHARLAELDAQREALLEQMTKIGRTTQLDDVDLLRGIIGGVERWIANNNLPHDPDKKAALIALLFSYFKQAGQVDQTKLDELLKAIA